MNIIVPPGKKRRWPYAALAALLLAAAAAGGVWVGRRASIPSSSAAAADNETAAEKSLRSRVETFENELRSLGDALRMAEEFGDRSKYMEIVSVSAAKHVEADEAWRKWQAEKHGLRDGLEDGIFETWMKRFTAEDKFRMLSERHGLSVDALKVLKGEFEVLFAEEMAEKFAAPEETEAAA